MITVERKTTESQMKVTLSPGPVADDYRKKINTPLMFLNHMIEHIVWRSGINITAEVALDAFPLSHVIAEDLGQALGRGVAAYYEEGLKNGISGYGDAIGIIDEAKASCAISFESRALFCFDKGSVSLSEQAEGMQTEDLLVFLDGFCQGARCTMHLSLEKGENAHHIWEAAFRAVGIALGRVLEENPARKGMTAGVAGAVSFTVTSK